MLLDPVFPKVCSADHLWSARSGQVVRELQYKLLDYANARYLRTLTCSSLWKRLKTTTRSSRFSTFWDCIDVVVVVAVTQLNECKLCKTVFFSFFVVRSRRMSRTKMFLNDYYTTNWLSLHVSRFSYLLRSLSSFSPLSFSAYVTSLFYGPYAKIKIQNLVGHR